MASIPTCSPFKLNVLIGLVLQAWSKESICQQILNSNQYNQIWSHAFITVNIPLLHIKIDRVAFIWVQPHPLRSVYTQMHAQWSSLTPVYAQPHCSTPM